MAALNKLFLLKFIFFFGLLILGIREAFDPDLWWHLKTGEHILSYGIPKADIFSFTVAGQPWVLHEWLSEIVLALVYRLGGLKLLMVFFAVLLPASFYFVYRRADGVAPPIVIMVSLWGAWVVGVFWGARPQVFNVVMLSFFIWFLEEFQMKRISLKRLLFTFVPVMVLWVNLHSGFLLGFVVLGCFWFAQCLEEFFQNGRQFVPVRVRYGFIFIAVACGISAGLFNPEGFRIFTYPFLTLGNQLQQGFIAEWQSPDFHLMAFKIYLGFVVLSIGSFILTPRKLSWFEIILCCGSFVAGLMSARHIPFFVIVATPIICKSLQTIFPRLKNLFAASRESLRAKGGHFLILCAVFILGCSYANTQLDKNERHAASHPLVKAVDFIYQSNMQGLRGFNFYDWGGYLIWRDIKVFIDGRADLYQDTVLRQYVQLTSFQPGWESILESYKIDYVIFGDQDALPLFLRKGLGWSLIYNGQGISILIRNRN